MGSPKDLTGQKFTRLTAIRCLGVDAQHNRSWECRCDCGNIVTAPASRLVFGNTRSCGCLSKDVNRARLKAAGYYTEKVVAKNKERATHGEARRSGKTRTYLIWSGLSQRYRKPKYKGVLVCVRWKDYSAFLEDMGPCPSPKHTIDRIKNHLGYTPGNCRWATMKEQQNNRTNNRHITAKIITLTLAQWSDRTGIPNNTIANRIDRLGWSVEEALELD